MSERTHSNTPVQQLVIDFPARLDPHASMILDFKDVADRKTCGDAQQSAVVKQPVLDMQHSLQPPPSKLLERCRTANIGVANVNCQQEGECYKAAPRGGHAYKVGKCAYLQPVACRCHMHTGSSSL